jgi:hypothetical protein
MGTIFAVNRGILQQQQGQKEQTCQSLLLQWECSSSALYCLPMDLLVIGFHTAVDQLTISRIQPTCQQPPATMESIHWSITTQNT